MPADPCAGEAGAVPRTHRLPNASSSHCFLELLPLPACPVQDVPEFLSPYFSAGADALITAHDFLSWIKQEEEPCVREPWELPEREMLTGPGPGE